MIPEMTLSEQETRVLNFYRDHPFSDWVDCSEGLGISQAEALDTSIGLEMRRFLDSKESPTTIRCFAERVI
jgi:hypothetical protein